MAEAEVESFWQRQRLAAAEVKEPHFKKTPRRVQSNETASIR